MPRLGRPAGGIAAMRLSALVDALIRWHLNRHLRKHVRSVERRAMQHRPETRMPSETGVAAIRGRETVAAGPTRRQPP